VGATLVIEMHGWRGVKRCGGHLGMVVTLGFVSVCFVPFLLSDWIEVRITGMRNALKRDMFPEEKEMGVWGEDRPLHRVVKRAPT
jgi:hypothetical protein